MIEENKDPSAPQVEDFDLFSMAFSSAAIGMALVAIDGRFVNVNEALCRITGYSRSELLARNFQAITHPDDLEIDLDHARQLLAGERKSYQMEKRYVRKDGSIAWVLLTGSLARRPSGEPRIFIAQVQDMGAQKQVESELSSFFALCSDPLAIASPEGVLTRVNPAWETVLGWTPAELHGLPVASLLHPDDVERTIAEFRRIANRGKGDALWVNRYRHKNGSYRWLQWTTSVRDDGSFLGVGRNITEQYLNDERIRRQRGELEAANERLSTALFELREANDSLEAARSQLERLAWFDSLTGLGNRNRFIDRLAKMIADSAKTEREFALLFIDLNGFKAVNDGLGHAAGDIVLREVARRLQTALHRDVDQAFRLGGDEFAVLIPPGITEPADRSTAIARKIADSLTQPMRVKGREYLVRGSIGIALYPRHGTDTDTLVRRADAAMYEAKSGGTSPVMASDLGATTVLKNLLARFTPE